MQTKPKANSIITHEVRGGAIMFTVKGAGNVLLDTGKLSQAVQSRAMLHGMIQRISDAAAIGRNPETGASATPEEKLANMAALVAHYESGTAEWSRKRGTGEGRDTSGITLQAIARVKGITEDAARASVEAYAAKSGIETKEAYRTLAKAKAVAEAILVIKAERLAGTEATLDADEALAGLTAGDLN